MAPRTNLPQPLTRLIGREQDLTEIRQRLARSRLVSLTGPGGCGKTRLALAVVAELQAGFPDGVGWVELAASPAKCKGPRGAASAARRALPPGGRDE